jgi:hypothetical protein
MQNFSSQPHSVALPPALFNRLGEAALTRFESPDTLAASLINAALAPRVRRRDGGKAPAKSLLRPVTLSSKRGRVLRYFLHNASVAAAMVEFGLSRNAVFATWTTLNLVHGVGYAFDSNADAITVRLPCDEADVFGGAPMAVEPR